MQIPRVLEMSPSAAVAQVEKAGLHARLVYRRRAALPRQVYAESATASGTIARGSTITLYVALPLAGK